MAGKGPKSEDPPHLKPPDQILRALADRLTAPGRPVEKVYLRSLNPQHRWGRSSFTGVKEEFRYKTIWVAKVLRESFGSPDHSAFAALRRTDVRGVRAAAWFLGSAVGYVVERRLAWSHRVLLGAIEPAWRGEPPDPDALDAQDAARLLGHLVVH